MASSINNWLGFSLSPQHQQQLLPPSESHDEQSLISNDIADYAPPLAISTSSFNVYNHHHHSNDWSMNGSTSELSMLVGSSSRNHHQNDHVLDEPKLENFLGNGHSFNNDSNSNPNNDYTTFSNNNPNPNPNPSSNNGIGLSMIKTWLRNQPAAQQPPPQAAETENVAAAVAADHSGVSSSALAPAAATTHGLSLSMSTGTSELENVNAQKGAIEPAAPKKSVDTFGQRTSIYRGVTR